MAVLIQKNRILQDMSFRDKAYDQAVVRFNSIISTNMSGTVIRGNGRFAGNVWEACNFFGAQYKGLQIEMDRYKNCSFGNVYFKEVQMDWVKAENCSFVGSVWEDVELAECEFINCNFHMASFRNVSIDKVHFENCIFEDGFVL